MQNSIPRQKILTKKVDNIKIEKIKAKLHNFFAVKYEQQMDAEEIIDRLNIALSFGKTITIQTRVNEYSDNVVDRTGKLIQNTDGNLFIQENDTLIKISPALIQYVY
ncbi:MAG: RNA recognition motif domain-containing protein [Lactobacillaceae bacterium]|nr:RNA recognition motif domain-containing protein [Lactobacillaceae bacterium]